MADIVYNRTFRHEDWIDNEDVVQAAGERGFNTKFHAIEDELDRISQVVQQINTALSSIGEQIAEPVAVVLTPVLLPYGASAQWSSIYWSRTSGGQPLGTYVEKPTSTDQAWGVYPLSLPNGATLMDIKVLGEQEGSGQVTTDVYQESRIAPYARASLVTVNGLADASIQATEFPDGTTYDGVNNLYYILVRVRNAAGSTIRLRGFQLTYQE